MQASAAARRPRRPRIALEAWYPGGSSLHVLERRLRRSLLAAGVPAAARLQLRHMPERSWVKVWRKGLRPLPIGRRFLVLPESVPAPSRARRIAIRVPFGQAFGTGEHATTRLCLRLLESHLKVGDRVVDLGTGTGILAVAARRLGASSVLAVDADPIAVRVARETLRRNRLAGSIRLRCSDAADVCRRGRYDLALVNIGARVTERILPDLARAIGPGGRAVIAGHLIDDEPAIDRAARPWGLRPAARLRSRPWSALVLRRSDRA